MTTATHRPTHACTCHPCRFWQAEWRRQRAAHPELKWRYVDAAPVTAHIERLNASNREIAYYAGLTPKIVKELRRPRHPRILERNATAILLVKPEEVTGIPPMATGETELRPTVRLLEGLAAQGWALGKIAEMTGVSEDVLPSVLRPGRLYVKKSIADAVAACAAQLGDAEGTSTHARNRAARRGWLPLIWGTDAQIAEQCEVYHCTPADLPAIAKREAAGNLMSGEHKGGRGKSLVVFERRQKVEQLRQAGHSIKRTAELLNLSPEVVTADRVRYSRSVAA